MTTRDYTASAADGAVSIALMDTLAEIEDTTTAEIEPPLYEVIDPDALDRIFVPTDESNRNEGRINFKYIGYTITVSSDGFIQIEDGTDRDAEEPV